MREKPLEKLDNTIQTKDITSTQNMINDARARRQIKRKNHKIINVNIFYLELHLSKGHFWKLKFGLL